MLGRVRGVRGGRGWGRFEVLLRRGVCSWLMRRLESEGLVRAVQCGCCSGPRAIIREEERSGGGGFVVVVYCTGFSWFSAKQGEGLDWTGLVRCSMSLSFGVRDPLISACGEGQWSVLSNTDA